jgi:hypothetical protein
MKVKHLIMIWWLWLIYSIKVVHRDCVLTRHMTAHDKIQRLFWIWQLWLINNNIKTLKGESVCIWIKSINYSKMVIYLTRDVSIIGESEIGMMKKMNIIIFTIIIKNFINSHKQSNSSIITFSIYPINLQNITQHALTTEYHAHW